MVKRIVIIGQSSLSYFLAQILERQLANHTHYRVIWLLREKFLVHPPVLDSVWSATTAALPLNDWPYLKARVRQVISVNLREQLIRTTREELAYDCLILDQTPVLTLRDYQLIGRQLLTLAGAVQAKRHYHQPVSSHVRIEGQNAETYQLALTVSRDIRRSFPQLARLLSIAVPAPDNAKLSLFLKQNGLVFTVRNQEPGLLIRPSVPGVNLRRVRGLKLGFDSRPVIDDMARVAGFANVWLLDQTDQNCQVLLRPSFNLARQVAKNVVSNVERQASTASIEATPAWRLRGSTDFIWLGDYSGSGWRAKLVADFDDRYWQRLLAQRVAKVADQA